MKYEAGDRVLVDMKPLPQPVEYVVSSVWPKSESYVLIAPNLPGATYNVITVHENEILKNCNGWAQ